MFTLNASTRGILLTANASADTKASSWTTVGTTTFAWELMIVTLDRASAGADYIIDIGIDDGGGNVWVLVPDLRLASRKGANELGVVVAIPVHVPSGAQLRARCACSTGSATMDIMVRGFSLGPGGQPGFTKVIALYAAATSRGVTVDPGGTGNTKVRTQLIASSDERIGAAFAMIGPNADVARTASTDIVFDIETGANPNERIILPNFRVVCNTGCDNPFPQSTPVFPCDVPAGERFSANCQSSNTSAGDRTIDLALYGLVP